MFERTFENHHKFSLYNLARERERLTLIYDFRVKAFENMINISPSLQAVQVIVVSPTKAVNKSEKEDGHACSLLLVSKG